MGIVISISSNARIVGAWKHRDGISDIEFAFSVVDGAVNVSVVDSSDGEKPEVYDINWSERELVLRFAVHWSSGRFVKYQVAVGPDPDRLQATITSSTQELWERL